MVISRKNVVERTISTVLVSVAADISFTGVRIGRHSPAVETSVTTARISARAGRTRPLTSLSALMVGVEAVSSHTSHTSKAAATHTVLSTLLAHTN